MFCSNCGAKIEFGEKFCGECGTKIEVHANIYKKASNTLSKEVQLEQINYVAEKCVPNVLRAKFPKIPAIAFIGFYAIIIIIVICILSCVANFGHDLSGTYKSDNFFMIGKVSFYTDGTFTAYGGNGCSPGYDVNKIYHGKYSKKGNEYEMSFTDADIGIRSLEPFYVQKSSNGKLKIYYVKYELLEEGAYFHQV